MIKKIIAKLQRITTSKDEKIFFGVGMGTLALFVMVVGIVSAIRNNNLDTFEKEEIMELTSSGKVAGSQDEQSEEPPPSASPTLRANYYKLATPTSTKPPKENKSDRNTDSNNNSDNGSDNDDDSDPDPTNTPTPQATQAPTPTNTIAPTQPPSPTEEPVEEPNNEPFEVSVNVEQEGYKVKVSISANRPLELCAIEILFSGLSVNSNGNWVDANDPTKCSYESSSSSRYSGYSYFVRSVDGEERSGGQ